MYSRPKLPAKLKCTLIRDIQFRHPDGKVKHICVMHCDDGVTRCTTLGGVLGNRLAWESPFKEKFMLQHDADNDEYGRSFLISLAEDINVFAEYYVGHGYECYYDAVNNALDNRIPSFMREYIVDKAFAPCGKIVQMLEAKQKAQRHRKLVSVQQWLKKHHPDLTALPPWNIPLAIKV